MPERRGFDLEISEDLTFQRRSWMVERIGWAVLAAVVAAALLGLFGRGLIGTASVAADDGRLAVELYRFWRIQSPTRLRIRIAPSAIEGRQARIWLDRSYVDGVDLLDVTPEPQAVTAAADRLVYTFAVADDRAPVVVTFNVEHERAWSNDGRVGLVGGPDVSFSQFIYP